MFIETIESIESRFTRRSIARALVGSINASMIGVASNIVRRTQREEIDGPSIDQFNEARNAEGNPIDPPVGLEAQMDPMEKLGLLNGVKQAVLDAANQDPDHPDYSVESSLEFMTERSAPNGGAAVDALAEVLGVDRSELVKIQEAMFTQDQKFLKENAEDILDTIASAPYGAPSEAFEALPDRDQGRLVAKLLGALDKAQGWALQAVLKGSAAALSDVILLKAQKDALDAWATNGARSTEFEEGLAA